MLGTMAHTYNSKAREAVKPCSLLSKQSSQISKFQHQCKALSQNLKQKTIEEDADLSD